MNIGKQIKTMREKKDMTQEELAEKCGITVNYIYYLEHNKRDPSMYLLWKMADVFEMKLVVQFKEAEND